MLRAYFDDSGTHKGSPVAVWAGLIGIDVQWERLESAWATKLKQPLPGKPPLKLFHLAACAAAREQFRDYKPADGDAVRYDFRSIIIEAGLFSIGSVVSRPDWDELITGELRNRLGDAGTPCFLNCIRRGLEWARGTWTDENKIVFIFDEGQRNDHLQSLIDRLMAVRDRKPPQILDIGFSRVEASSALQAADTVATESFWAAQEWLKSGSTANATAHFKHFVNNLGGEGLIADREVILEIVRATRPDRSHAR